MSPLASSSEPDLKGLDALIESVSRHLRSQLAGANGETAWGTVHAFCHAVDWRARGTQERLARSV